VWAQAHGKGRAVGGYWGCGARQQVAEGGGAAAVEARKARALDRPPVVGNGNDDEQTRACPPTPLEGSVNEPWTGTAHRRGGRPTSSITPRRPAPPPHPPAAGVAGLPRPPPRAARRAPPGGGGAAGRDWRGPAAEPPAGPRQRLLAQVPGQCPHGRGPPARRGWVARRWGRAGKFCRAPAVALQDRALVPALTAPSHGHGVPSAMGAMQGAGRMVV